MDSYNRILSSGVSRVLIEISRVFHGLVHGIDPHGGGSFTGFTESIPPYPAIFFLSTHSPISLILFSPVWGLKSVKPVKDRMNTESYP